MECNIISLELLALQDAHIFNISKVRATQRVFLAKLNAKSA
jgi:hypothetical protein